MVQTLPETEARGGHRPDWRSVRPGEPVRDLRDDAGVELSHDPDPAAAGDS